MVTTRSFMNQTWTDLNSPTKEEVDSLVLTQNINPIIVNDLLTPTPAQHAKDEDRIIYMVLHIPAFERPHFAGANQEVDFIISADGVVTARYDSIDALHYFAKRIEVNEILNKGPSSHLFFGIMKEIYKSMTDDLAYMEDWLKEIEKNIFEGQEKDMVFAISNASRNLLNFKRTIEPQSGIFEFLRNIGKEKFGREFEAEAKILIEEWRQIMRRVDNQADLATELRETNNSMLSTKQNEIMKKLAIIGFVLLPLTFIGQLFGLSIRYLPLINHPYAFWIILGFMAAVMLVSLIFAKLKKWM
jgi:magnesium transporter